MMCSASGTYSLPSAFMKSYWVSTSQKMTLAMRPSFESWNFSRAAGGCQPADALQLQNDGDFVTAVLPGAPGAVRPHLEGKMAFFGEHEAELVEEGGLARQRQHFGDAAAPRLRHQGLHQDPAHAGALLVRTHRQPRHLGQVARVDLEGAASHEVTVGCFGDQILLHVPAQIVVAARQQVAGGDVRGHERLEGRDVEERRPPHDRFPRERGDGRGHARGADAVRRAERTSPVSRLPDVERQRAHARISSSIATPRSSSCGVMTSGGTSRSTFAPAVRTSSPRSRAAVTHGAAGSASSSPHISPRPRASRTFAERLARPASRAPSHSPFCRTAARKSGWAMVRTTSSATLATRGPPPNVVAWSPGLSALAIASRSSTAPIGRPPASGLASVSTSGTTPVCSYANSVPVRPSPHCTSSKMTATPRESHNSRRKPSHSGSIGRTPPSPCTGSTITAAVRDADTAWSTAAQSSRGTIRMPGTSGSSGFLYSGRSVAASVAKRRPWKLPLKATISLFPDHLRANLNAASFASAPELQKNTRSANDRATSSSASRSAGSVRYRFEMWMSPVPSACSTAWRTTGWL